MMSASGSRRDKPLGSKPDTPVGIVENYHVRMIQIFLQAFLRAGFDAFVFLSQRVLMIGHMEPFKDRTLEPNEDRGYGATS